MRAFLRDLSFGFRALRATPAAALAAVFTIALGAGANTAVFAVAYGVLFRPLPCPDPSRIVVVSFHASAGNETGVPLREIEDWQRRVRAFEATGAYTVAELTIRGIGEPRLVRTGLVTPSFFDVLRVPPRAGRSPSASDPDEWMVLGTRLSGEAARQGQSAAQSLGSSVTAGDRTFHVSAVMPPEFGFPADDVAAWLPAAPFGGIRQPSGREMPRVFRLMCRLKAGVSIDQARDDAKRAFAEGSTIGKDGGTTQLRTLDDVLFGKVRPVLNALVAAAILVLLVACGNVATLLVSRAVARSRDLAVRLSLGASSWQLARAALAESLLIAAAGSALGIALALACVRLFVRTATGLVPRLDAVAVDLPVLAATVLVAFGATLICGLAPAVHSIRSDFAPALRGSRTGASRGARLTRRALIVAQVAMSIVLLSGAGLIARTLFGLMSDRAGADPDRALVVKLMLADTPSLDLASRMPVIREILRTVRALPGVEHAAIGTNIPPRVASISFGMEETTNGVTVRHRLYLASVTSDFFEALGTRVLEGHGIDEADEQRDRPVIVLSESAVRLLSPGFSGMDGARKASLVGRELPWPLPAGAGKGRRPLVVGTVPDVKYGGLDAPAGAAIYTRWADLPANAGHLLVRTSVDPTLLASTLRKTLRQVAPSLAMAEIRTLRQEYATSVADRRIRLIPAVGFAGLAIAVALVGLGSLLARAVTERRRELAIRTVLGAAPGAAVGLIVREGILLAAAGVVLGLGGGAGAAWWLRSLLYGVRPLDPFTFGGVALVVATAALLTSFLAARRAAGIEPLELLRSE
jgi:predicted permease